MRKSGARREGRPLCWSLVELGLQPRLSSEDSKEQLRFLEGPDQVSGVIDQLGVKKQGYEIKGNV